MNLWRAPTDNDAQIMIEWLKAGFERIPHGTTRAKILDSSVIEIDTVLGAYSLARIANLRTRYTLNADGGVRIETSFTPVQANLPRLPKLGLQLQMPAGFDRFTWFGRGPQESYADMKCAAHVGLFSGSVQDQYVPHIRPQESGNKSDVRWAAVTNSGGVGLLAAGDELLNVSVHHFTTADRTATKHTYHLPKRDLTEVNLDHLQAPLGSNSCGPAPQQRCVSSVFPTKFAVTLTAFKGDIKPSFIDVPENSVAFPV